MADMAVKRADTEAAAGSAIATANKLEADVKLEIRAVRADIVLKSEVASEAC